MIYSVSPEACILVLFKRDDNERILLGTGYYEFKDSQLQFAANTFVNDTVDVQGGDGTLLAGQVRRASTQEFDGYIGDATTAQNVVEAKRKDFFKFFRKGHFYEAIYVFKNGTAIKRQRGFIVDAPEVQEEWQIHPEYHVALSFEDVNYYEYLEDEEGEEVFGHQAEITPSGQVSGGIIWDTVGATWDSVGMIWEAGSGIQSSIVVDSVDNITPTIVISAVTTNPIIENTTTSTKLTYTGSIQTGQSLVIDCNNQFATLNGVNVTSNLSGNWISLAPGSNSITYSATGTNVPDAVIKWAEVVG